VSRLVLVLAMVLCAGALAMASRPGQPGAGGTRFEAFDVFVDAGARPLAAWQVEVKPVGVRGQVTIVGIEGGEHAAFAGAPYYDPVAMQSERVIVAGLSTAADLPRGRTRVARIHVQVEGAEPEWAAMVQAAAGADGVKFGAAAQVVAAGQGEGK
jgi:hypothetical protein